MAERVPSISKAEAGGGEADEVEVRRMFLNVLIVFAMFDEVQK